MSEQLQELEWFINVAYLVELSIPFMLAIHIGWDRKQETRSMGLRTFPLVAIASCGYMNLQYKPEVDRRTLDVWIGTDSCLLVESYISAWCRTGFGQ